MSKMFCRNSSLLRSPRWQPLNARRCLNTMDVPAPPLLLKLRSDMKAAMKAKDTNRLNVLRSILAETTNAAKTAKPFRTDVQLLSLLRKRAAASREAAQEFSSHKRQDLEEKEMAQVAVLEQYASEVETLSEEEVKESIRTVIDAMKAQGKTIHAGSVVKELLGPEGVLNGKPVESAEVARLAKGMI